MHYFIALVSGLIFGLGLLISGLANPSKVLAFLDLAGLGPVLGFGNGGGHCGGDCALQPGSSSPMCVRHWPAHEFAQAASN